MNKFGFSVIVDLSVVALQIFLSRIKLEKVLNVFSSVIRYYTLIVALNMSCFCRPQQRKALNRLLYPLISMAMQTKFLPIAGG